MAAEIAAKRLKTSSSPSSHTSPLSIGTHNGHFHADEALAVYMLRMLPAYASSTLVRTRDPEQLAACHTVVDVGGEYDAARNRFDHHQRGFATTFPGRATKLSSAGLVYLHFGKAIIAQRLRDGAASASAAAAAAATTTSATAAAPPPLGATEAAGDDAGAEANDVRVLFDKLYESFVEAVDAHDNGIAAYDPALLAAAAPGGLSKRFSDGGFSLGASVARLNAHWNEAAAPAGDGDDAAAAAAAARAREDARFLLASARMGDEFARDLDYLAGAWLPARAVVRAAYARRRAHDARRRVLVLEGPAVPWKDHLYSLEKEDAQADAAARSNVEYVLYPETPAPGAKWRVQAVPVSSDSFESRRPLPEAWRGLRDEELDGVAGIEGCVFVHAAGFIGGNKTFEGAMAMALKALEM